MSNNHRFHDLSLTDSVSNEPYNPKYDLSARLLAQHLDNTNNTQPRTYLSFPSDHPGHLTLENQIRLVEVIRSSSIANQYRFGTSVGKLYVKNTYRHPITSSEMIGVVLLAESTPN
ncbi:MAG: hypothetical protein O7D30_01485 [Rickettsia endosymbiont of Ixodes persulcatus]|nr:hypothetical protein [Rickettsia endosymbiont of Ixodes persulcatus]